MVTGRAKELRVSFMGRIQTPIPLVSSSLDNPIDVQIVDVVEEAQLKGLFSHSLVCVGIRRLQYLVFTKVHVPPNL